MIELVAAGERVVQFQLEGSSSDTAAPPAQAIKVFRAGSYLNPGAVLLTTDESPVVAGSEYFQVFRFQTRTLPEPTVTNSLRTGSIAPVGLLYLPGLIVPRCL